MKNILTLIPILFFFSCDNSTEPQDCAGVAGGDAVEDCSGICNGTASIDDCGLCTGGTTELEINYLMDECGECGGDGVVDCTSSDDMGHN